MPLQLFVEAGARHAHPPFVVLDRVEVAACNPPPDTTEGYAELLRRLGL